MLKLIKKRFMNASIGTRLVVVIYAVIVGIFILLSAVLLVLAEKTSQQDLLRSMLDTVDSGSLLIEKEQQYLMGIAEYYSLSSPVQELFLTHAQGGRHTDSTEIMQAVRARMYCAGLAFYDLAGTPIEYMSIDNSWGPVPQDGDRPLQRIVAGSQLYEWEFIDQGDVCYMTADHSPKITLWYLVKDTHTFRPLGVLAVSLDSRRIFSSSYEPGSPYRRLTVLDRSGRAVFSRHSPALSAQARETLLAGTSDGSITGHFIAVLDGVKYRVAYDRVDQSYFYTYVLVPYHAFTWNLGPFYGYAVAGVLLSAFLLFPILLITSQTMVRPLQGLAASMRQFKSGNFEAKVDFHYNDEIGQLGRLFNEMVQENRKLIESTYLLKIRQQEAELDALQAQINPHFLYNLINSIQWSALSKGEAEIADVAYSMGQFFRISLNRGGSVITVRQERDLIAYYLKLQKWRYSDRIVYTVTFPEDILELHIPKLILQPLVENSVVHGAECSSQVIHITVRAAASPDGARILLSVSDDGAGIPPAILCQLPESVPAEHASPGSRFAIKNIYDRLKLTYGDDFAFTIDSEAGTGTLVQLSLPSALPAPERRKEAQP